MKTIKVKVTQRDIELGRALCKCDFDHSDKCPIAVRLHAMKFKRWVVRETFVQDDEGYALPLPANARRFIGRFDRGKDVQPFTFTLKIP